MMRMLARIMGIGIETADMLVHEVLSRKLRDQRAVARYGARNTLPHSPHPAPAAARAHRPSNLAIAAILGYSAAPM
jgi:hypothetical protein